jgi:hypothetical protein
MSIATGSSLQQQIKSHKMMSFALLFLSLFYDILAILDYSSQKLFWIAIILSLFSLILGIYAYLPIKNEKDIKIKKTQKDLIIASTFHNPVD